MHPAGSTISIPTKLLATGVACAVAVVVCGTAASVVVASDATGKLKKYSDARKAVASGYKPSDSFRDTGENAARIDSLLLPLGRLPQAQPLDIAVINTIGQNTAAPLDPVWESSPLAKSPGAMPVGHRRSPIFKGGIDTTVMNAEWIAGAIADTANPWMPVFRRWARSAPLPPLWGYRQGLPGAAEHRGVPARPFALIRTLFDVNTEAGLLAFREGRYDIAMERARENMAGARHLIEQPVELDAMLGRIELGVGIRLLSMSARASGDSVTLRRATVLDSAIRKYYFGPAQLTAEEADPRSKAAEAVIADQSMLPSHRMAAFDAIIRGGCRNTREVVFGFDERRRDAIERALASVSDIHRGPELAQQSLQYFDRMTNPDQPAREPVKGSVLDRNEILKLFSWIVPPGVRARATLCLEQG